MMSPPPSLPRIAANQARHDLPHYAELHCLSDFSFQRGASQARELFARAQALGYRALAITDECSLAGIVRAWEASREFRVRLIVGSEFQLEDGPRLVLLVEHHEGYARLCQLITLARRRAGKGHYQLRRADVESLGEGLCVLWAPGPWHNSDPATRQAHGAWVARHFAGRAWLAVELHRGPDDNAELGALEDLGARWQLPCVACGDVHMHLRRRRMLQDAMTAIRLNTPLEHAGTALFPNGERHLRHRALLAVTYPPHLLRETRRIAARCRFRLDRLHYVYPHELVPAGLTPRQHLADLSWRGAAWRWPGGIPEAVRAQIRHELALIAAKRYESFFLTVEDIVREARRRGILCQGRGSAANSAVCYCLGITSVPPDHDEVRLLFERFISETRDEPPDIDVDFEHQRREEIMQYVFAKYGRERAALAATVIRYQPKSAIRDLGRVLGFSRDQLDMLSSVFARGQDPHERDALLRERGFDPTHRRMRWLLHLARQLLGMPRHLSQHVGGFVISETPLHHLVPVENAAMAERTIIQWDKDDLESLGLLKVDCLALGMLTCLRLGFELIARHGGPRLGLADMDMKDPATYAMIGKADVIGTFQIESRAQMSMLPRLRPASYYDLVVQVAIVRPGPIQGGMVHPYLERRQLPRQAIPYASPGVRKVLERTLGIPIFQEQVMALLQEVADFSPGEADDLRRSMAAWKRRGGVEKFEPRIRERMRAKQYEDAYIDQLLQQIRGFGSYGFPESHAASFALLAYASSYLKCHYPAHYACALLNAQPMGFYGPAQIVQDLRRHGIPVRPADVTASDWDCTLEATERPATWALRLGLRQLAGVAETAARRIVAARAEAPFRDLADLCRRAVLDGRQRQSLARAGALRVLCGHRHRAYWESAGIEPARPLLANAEPHEARIRLRPPSLTEDVLSDYRTQGLSLTRHPLALIRRRLEHERLWPARLVLAQVDGRRVRHAGLVTVRQQPGTAKGIVFVTLEDETGMVNVIIRPPVMQRQRRILLEAVLLGVEGHVQTQHGVCHLVARHLYDFSALLPDMDGQSRDFH